jgi:hypothetical protein
VFVDGNLIPMPVLIDLREKGAIKANQALREVRYDQAQESWRCDNGILVVN